MSDVGKGWSDSERLGLTVVMTSDGGREQVVGERGEQGTLTSYCQQASQPSQIGFTVAPSAT